MRPKVGCSMCMSAESLPNVSQTITGTDLAASIASGPDYAALVDSSRALTFEAIMPCARRKYIDDLDRCFAGLSRRAACRAQKAETVTAAFARTLPSPISASRDTCLYPIREGSALGSIESLHGP